MSRTKWLWRNWFNKKPLWEGLFIHKNNKEMLAENKFGYSEIVDTLVDGINAEMKAREIFKGKFDVIKVVTWALQEYPTVKEAADDWPVFKAEIKDLMASEGIEALAEIESKLSQEVLEESRLLRVVRFAAKGYQNTLKVIELGEEQIELGADIFA